MKKRRYDFLLGLVVITFLALLLGTVLFLVPAIGVKTRPIVVYFPHEAGLAPLKEGSLVLLSGAIEIGHVSKVEIQQIANPNVPGAPPQTVVVVDAEVDKDVSLYGNCEITTDMPLVGGSGTMVIRNVGTPDIPLTDKPIEGLPPQGLAAFTTISRRLTEKGGLVDRIDFLLDADAEGSLLNKIMLSLSDVNAITQNMKVQFTVAEHGTLVNQLHLMLDDLNAVTATIREQMRPENGASAIAKVHAALDLIHRDLGEVLALLSENRPVVHDALTSVAHAAETIDKELLPNLQREFDPRDSASLLSKLHESLDTTNTALADLSAVTSAGREVFVLNRPQIERIIGNVRDMSEELTLGSKELRLNPSRLIWGPGKQKESQLAAFSAARDFAQAAAYLDDVTTRLEAILQLPESQVHLAQNEQEVREIYESLQNAFERFEHAEQFFWEQIK